MSPMATPLAELIVISRSWGSACSIKSAKGRTDGVGPARDLRRRGCLHQVGLIDAVGPRRPCQIEGEGAVHAPMVADICPPPPVGARRVQVEHSVL